jgi:predicted ATP-grasp superfamily ATP-dependent carboligase
VAAPLACVIGELDLVRALAEGGIASAVVAPEGAPVLASRFARERVSWADPWREPDALVASLRTFARAQDVPPVLYYDGDWDLLAVSRERERLAPALMFVVAERELVEDLVDKARFTALTERLALPVPAARTLDPARDDAASAAELGLPVVVKPLTRQHATWRPLVRAKAAEARTRDELDAVWERLSGAGSVLVQRLIPGPERAIESYHVYVDDSGAVAGEFTGRKLRTRPPAHGYTTALEITSDDGLVRLGRELVDRLGLRGVAKLDFKRGPDGTLWLLEVNPRFNLWHYPGAIAGVNLPELVYRDLVGLPRPPVRRARAGVRWCAPRDLLAARADGMSVARWLAFARACEARPLLALDDPLPFAAAVARIVRRR